MFYFNFTSLVEEKCRTIKRNVEELLDSLPTQTEENAQTDTSINSYKQQIDSLTEELKKVKEENILLHEQIQQLKNNNNKMTVPPAEPCFNSNIGFNFSDKSFGKLASLENEIQINDIYASDDYFTPCILSDGRIVSPSGENHKSISIFSINYELNTWKKDIYKENAHNGQIRSFVELSNSRLISCSTDTTIKIWLIKTNDLTEIKTLAEHSTCVNRITALNKNRFASASNDKTIIIWNNEEPYNIIKKLTNRNSVWNLLFVKSKEMLVASYSGGLEFWNLRTYNRESIIENTYTEYSISSMIE